MKNEQQLAHAYRRTSYWLQTHPPICVRVGEVSAALDSLLKDLGVDTWAFVTAFNPHSRRLSDTENRARDAALIEQLDRGGWRHIACDGVDDDGTWPTEHGHVIFGIDAQAARALGRRFAQNAILLGRVGEAPLLSFCESRVAGVADKKAGPKARRESDAS